MITWEQGGIKFNHRIAAVIVHGDRVLLHQWENHKFWALPGGRAELLEPSEQSLRRELREEMNVDAVVGRLIWVVENFFKFEGKDYHEIGFYYWAMLPAGCPYLKQETFEGREGDQKLFFQWFPLKSVGGMNIYPRFLTKSLLNIPPTTQHRIEIDPVSG